MKSLFQMFLLGLLFVSLNLGAEEPKGMEEFKQLHNMAWTVRTAEAIRKLYETQDADPQVLEQVLKEEENQIRQFPQSKHTIVGFKSISEMEAQVQAGNAKDSRGRNLVPVFKHILSFASRAADQSNVSPKPNIPVIGVIEIRTVVDGSDQPKGSAIVTSVTPVGLSSDGKLRYVLQRAEKAK